MLRASVALALLLALALAPVWLALRLGLDPLALAHGAHAGFELAVDAVGWVLLPQLLLAIGVLGLALEKAVARLGGLEARVSPAWLGPAIESALLLGMLGTISGMVSGFAGSSPDEIEPGPLLHSLGTALRSSFVGFGIALVGVWAQPGPVARETRS